MTLLVPFTVRLSTGSDPGNAPWLYPPARCSVALRARAVAAAAAACACCITCARAGARAAERPRGLLFTCVSQNTGACSLARSGFRRLLRTASALRDVSRCCAAWASSRADSLRT